ncbi:MAG: peptidylprolyl isomerase [Planctomycetota bacterium]
MEAVIQTNKGDMVVTFYPHKAPITVKNFVDLCMKGFYDGLTFHRIVSGFMIQGGCPIGDGTGDPGYLIAGEFSDVSHERGVISMARSEDPDSAGCQFFIMHQDNPGLDGLYAAFGKLVSGYDTLDRLAEVETQHQRSSDEKSRPAERLVIEKIFIRPGKTTSKSAESGSPDLNGEQQ